MLPALTTAAHSAFYAARTIAHIGALSGATALELHPLVFALFSACSGVLLASATVFSRSAAARAPRAAAAPGAPLAPPTPDDCGQSIFFSLRPYSAVGLTNAERAAAAARKAVLNRKQKKTAEAEVLAESYSQFSIVDMTFETSCVVEGEKIAAPEKPEPEAPGKDCVVDIPQHSVAESDTSLTMSSVSSSVSPPATPLPRTPRSQSPPLRRAHRSQSPVSSAWDSDSNGSRDSEFHWIPPQSPIIVIRGEYAYRKPVKVAAPVDVPKKVDEDELNSKSTSLVTAHSSGSNCPIVCTVGLNQQSKSKALGSQLVELSILDDPIIAEDDTSRRQWSFFAPWRAFSVDTESPMRI